MTIAIVDSGIDVDNPEFAGRISGASKSFESRYARCGTCSPETETFDLNDVQGHGTWVASVAAAARDDSGAHGVAFDSQIMALKVASVDVDNLKPGEKPQEGGVNAGNIAAAIQHAVVNGAFVINISINGTSSGQMGIDQNAAMDQVRLNNRLVVESVSNFDGVDSFKDSIAQNLVGVDFENKDWFLFGIRLNTDLTPPTVNGVPGALADRTLSVVGNNVLVAGLDGKNTYVGGNSFAAPAIAGAAALLKQYWPQLGGKEISQILLTTATDLGEPGVDQTFGVGLMNIEQAMKAQAPTIGSGATSASVAKTSLVFSSAFGGGAGEAKFGATAGTAVILDKFGRDYQLDVRNLAGSIQNAGISLASLAQPHTPAYVDRGEQAKLAFNLTDSLDGYQTRLPAGSFVFGLSPQTRVAGSLNASIDSPTMMTGSLLRSSGIATFGQAFSLTSAGQTLGVAVARSGRGNNTSHTSSLTMELRNGVTLGLTSNREIGSALGLRGTGAFQIEGARSNFVTAGWNGDLGGFRLTGEGLLGRTRVQTRNAVIEFSDPVLSTGFRLQAERSAFGGMALVGLTSPLKVEHAQLRYTLPVAYDLETRTVIEATRFVSLAPEARELNLEMGWTRGFGNANISLGGAYGFNTGNIAGRSSAAGWLRFNTAL